MISSGVGTNRGQGTMASGGQTDPPPTVDVDTAAIPAASVWERGSSNATRRRRTPHRRRRHWRGRCPRSRGRGDGTRHPMPPVRAPSPDPRSPSTLAPRLRSPPVRSVPVGRGRAASRAGQKQAVVLAALPVGEAGAGATEAGQPVELGRVAARGGEVLAGDWLDQDPDPTTLGLLGQSPEVQRGRCGARHRERSSCRAARPGRHSPPNRNRSALTRGTPAEPMDARSWPGIEAWADDQRHP